MCRAAIADELAQLVSEVVVVTSHMGGAPQAHVLSEVGVAVLKARGTETPTEDGA